MYDVCIIGAGVVGCAIARELSKYDIQICLLEKNEDVSTETTKANSGIVHGGYAAKHGKLKGKFSSKGNQLYEQLERELHFGFKRTGSFVVGFDKEDEITIKGLYENGIKNGAKGLKIVDGDFVREREPHISKLVTCALYCETAGITSSYELAIALAENAIANGVELKLNSKVIGIVKDKNHFIVQINSGEIKTKLVINAAGLYADEIARLVGSKEFVIKPKQGQYLLFDRDQAHLVNSVIFQAPTKAGKGILVTQTYHGNLLVGPSAEYVCEKDDVDTTADIIEYVVKTARKSIPDFNMKKVITAFSGDRASSDKYDFIIEESKVKRFINVAGIESPGLTAAPAIAVYVAEIVKQAGVGLVAKTDFNPKRQPYYNITEMGEEELRGLIKSEPAYGRIVCRCETVSEGEVLDALRRSIPINSLDAIKRRTRAQMGRCQGGFCTPRILEIIARELKIPAEKINKRNVGSYLLVGRTK
jgi:glycerol-3-phosphate dehydrogenase